MHTFKKGERLHGRNNIQRLFSQGKSFLLGPFRVHWYPREPEGPFAVRVLIAVSKRTTRHAVRRNLLKRRMREAFRQHKSVFYEFLTTKAKHYDLGIVYIGKDMMAYVDIEKKIIQILERLKAEGEKPWA